MSSEDALTKALKEQDTRTALKILAEGGLENLNPEGLMVAIARSARGDLLEQLVLLGGKVNEQDEHQLTPLHYSAAKNLHRAANVLAHSGADIEVRDAKGRTPLSLACIAGTEFIANILLKKGARLDVVDDQGRTPLMNAILHGNEKVASLLIQAKSEELNKKDPNGHDALRMAVDKGNIQLVKELLKQGAPLDSQDNMGRTVLHSAAARGNQEIINQLISAKANVTTQDQDGRTALMVAAGFGDIITAQTLIRAGSDVNARDRDGNTAMHIVSGAFDQKKMFEFDRILVKDRLAAQEDPGSDKVVISGSDPSAFDDASLFNINIKELHNLPLSQPNPEVYKQLSKILLQCGAEVDQQNIQKETALHKAVQSGSMGVIKELLNHNANPNLEDSQGKTAESYSNNNQAIKGLLVEAKEKIKKKAASLSRNASGLSLYLMACSEGKIEEVKKHLDEGAEINMKDFQGRTGLVLAACGGHIETVRLLVARGANVDLKDSKGANALILSVLSGQVNVVDTLLELRADVHVKLKGIPLILIAVARTTVPMIECLLKHKADIHAKDFRGGAIVNYAQANRLPEMRAFIQGQLLFGSSGKKKASAA